MISWLTVCCAAFASAPTVIPNTSPTRLYEQTLRPLLRKSQRWNASSNRTSHAPKLRVLNADYRYEFRRSFEKCILKKNEAAVGTIIAFSESEAYWVWYSTSSTKSRTTDDLYGTFRMRTSIQMLQWNIFRLLLHGQWSRISNTKIAISQYHYTRAPQRFPISCTASIPSTGSSPNTCTRPMELTRKIHLPFLFHFFSFLFL